ncbi:KEOPS complex subunit Pcc1 [Halobellus ruber]|uniref:KEOPS complex Pcc1-like subunit n=1 Tax=Halobellus ruber TaxID=2761102 RepID=A0A7J9SN06_9EURY|nr:KEOPS complex subunit Pcc1 [Halobellus ruber]MBB6647549.1 KEOPS complex Pcc1-like subunit [Halobellus ruber]
MPDRPESPAGRNGGPDADNLYHRLDADFEYATEQRARAVAESIAVEVGEISDGRSGATVDREDRVVSVEIGAADLVALRAGMNTWIRLVGVAEDVAGASGGRPGRCRD